MRLSITATVAHVDLAQSKGEAHLHIGASTLQNVDVSLLPLQWGISLVIRSKGVKIPTAQSSRAALICQAKDDEVIWELARCSWHRDNINCTLLDGKVNAGLITNPNVLVQQSTCNK